MGPVAYGMLETWKRETHLISVISSQFGAEGTAAFKVDQAIIYTRYIPHHISNNTDSEYIT